MIEFLLYSFAAVPAFAQNTLALEFLLYSFACVPKRTKIAARSSHHRSTTIALHCLCHYCHFCYYYYCYYYCCYHYYYYYCY